MDGELIGTIVVAVIGLFLFLLFIGLILAIIPLSMFLAKALAKSKWIRKSAAEVEKELRKERDGIEGFITISEIKEINDAQNVRIEALVIQNKEIIEKLNRLVEEKEGGNTK